MKTISEMLKELEDRKAVKNKRLEDLEKEYDRVADQGDWFIVWKGKTCGVVTFDSGEKHETMFEGVERIFFSSSYPYRGYNLICVQKNGKRGYVDNAGQEIIPCVYDDEVYLDKLGRIVYNVQSFLNGGAGDEKSIDFYVDVNDENLYRVLMHFLKNRFELEKAKNGELSLDFIDEEGYTVNWIIDSIQKTKNKSEVAIAGLAELQKFYDTNLKLDELKV